MVAAAHSDTAPDVLGSISAALLEHAPLSVCVVDREHRVVHCNGCFAAVFGPALGRTCYRVYKGREEPCPRCPADKTFRDGRFRVSDEHCVDMLGGAADFVVHHAPVRDAEGTVTHVINMALDVTERNALLREYNLLFEKVPCCLAVITRDYRIVRANEQARQTFGEALGSRCFEVYKQRRSQCEACPARRSFEDGQPHASREVRLTRDGRRAYHLVSTAPLSHNGDRVEQVIEMTMDVTDVEHLSEELGAQRLENERLAVAAETAAQVAHGIKNILTGLQGGVYSMKTGLAQSAPERVERGLSAFDRNFTRLTRLTRAFLSFSKEHCPTPVEVDAGELGQEVVQLYQPVAAQKGISLEFSLEPGAGRVWLDPEDIHTCLANLITNALDGCLSAGREQGRVVLRLGGTPEMVVFAVEDNGCGIEEELCEALFNQAVSTKGTSGTGLGLLVTGKIVEDHGGSIACDSVPGKGSVFTIELPRQGPDPHRRRPGTVGVEGA